jgi:biotin carboxylase
LKKLLLLGGSRYLLPVIREAKALGLHTITCDYLPENIAHRYSDEYHNVSITDLEATLALARELKVDGVMSFACDPGVVTAAYVAEKMGLPNVGPLESVRILQDKGRFRAFLRDHGFRVPWVRSFETPEEALAAAESLQYPLMVKPTDSAGSKGVSRVDRPEDLPAALQGALEYSRNGRLLLEGYLPQQGFSSDTDCFSVDGELKFVSFNNQYFDRKAENPYTPTGYTWPSTMPGEKQAELRAELQRLLRLLNMGTALYNIETRCSTDGEAYIMEVSPRGGGNRLSEMLGLCSGQNLIRNAVKAAVGLPAEELRDPDYNGHWSIVVLHADAAGRFRGLRVAEAARPYVREEDLWVRPGDEVEALSGASKAIGTLVMNWPTEEERDARMADVKAWVAVEVDG